MVKFASKLGYTGEQATDKKPGLSRFATNAEAAAGVRNDVSIDPEDLAGAVDDLLPNSSTTVVGKVRLATVAETLAGTSQTIATTPAGVAAVAIAGAPDASTTQKGIIEIATDGEAAAQASGTLALVPSNLPSVFGAPGTIGGTTPGNASFVNLSASGTFALTGDDVQVSEGGTGRSTLTAGAILYGDTANPVAMLAIGTARQILQTNAGATAPEWASNIDVPGTLDVTGAATLDSTLNVAGATVIDDSFQVTGTSALDGAVTCGDDLIVDTSTLFVDASQNNVGIGTATPAAADSLHVTRSTAGTAMIVEFEHSDNTNAASHSQALIQTGGASGGDPKVVFDVAATTQYSIGIDNSNSDILCISTGTAPGTTDNVQITSAGAVSVLRGDATITRDAGAASSLGLNITNTNAGDADSNALLAITSGNAASGDPQINLIVTGGSTHHIGIDNSDSDKLKIGLGATVGTTDNVTIATGGDVNVLRGDLITVRSSAGADVTTEVTNSDNTNGASRAGVEITVGGASAGDAYAQFGISAGQQWIMGLDNSASDAFVISRGSAIGTNNNISISTSDITTITQLALTTDLAVADGGTGASTLTDHGILVGSGTDPIDALAVGTNGQLLVGSTGADPVFASLGVSNGISKTEGAGTLSIQITSYAQTTFTPELTPTGTAYDSITYTTQNGHYTRIGNLVIFNVYIQINAVTVGSATGDLTITGLPIAAAASPVQLGLVCGTSGIDLPGTPVSVFAKILATEQFVRPFIVQDNGAATAIAATSVANSDQIWVQGMYMV